MCSDKGSCLCGSCCIRNQAQQSFNEKLTRKLSLNFFVHLFFLSIFLLPLGRYAGAADDTRDVQSPLSTDDALKSFELASSDLKVELVAAEPEIVDPVAIAFGADGSLWVVEMRDYPLGPKMGSQEKPKSRIKRLFDHNHDGRFETAVTFVDELLFATGVLPWKDGIIVTLAGEIVFFADRDDDGKADFRETWFQGFSEENSQFRANHPTLGPDGYIYVANGLRGGTIVAAKPEWRAKSQPLPLAGFDFRFNPLTGDYGAVAGHGQFGLCFDDFGNRFVCASRNPVQHVVIEDVFTKRNPFFAVKTTVEDVSLIAEFSKLHPISNSQIASTSEAKHFSAACGVIIFRGDGLPPENRGNAFVCDPTGNLVHRESLTPHGATFVSHPSDAQKEFLASTDTWFRPVNLANGPDGTLYIVDMYRAVIEHPDSMPPERRNRKDLYDGSDRGRIWRVKSDESILPQERPDQPLEKLTIPMLVQLLDHRNSWHRDTAFRLLLERNRDEVLDALKANWKKNRLTRSRLPVLWMIELLDPRLTPAVLAWSEVDNRDPRVREQVISMIGENLDELLPDDVGDIVADETDERVRFRLAIDLSGRSSDAAAERKALVRLLDRGVDDPWMRVAVCTMKSEPPIALILEILERWSTLKKMPLGGAELIEQLAEIYAKQVDPKSARAFLAKLLDFKPGDWGDNTIDVSAAGIRGVGIGATRQGKSFASFVAEMNANERNQLGLLMTELQRIATDAKETPTRRLTAIKTLAFGSADDVQSILLKIAFNASEISHRLAAIESLASLVDPAIGAQILVAFNSQPPQLRRAMLDLLMSQESWTTALLTALERREIKRLEIDPIRQSRLTKHRSKPIASRAEKIFAPISPNRSAVVADYQTSAEAIGDVKRGRDIFEVQCAACHRVSSIGTTVGPVISNIRYLQASDLLAEILDPNRAIDPNYYGSIMTTKYGRLFGGLVKSETSAAITIRQPDGKEDTILRSDVDQFKTNEVSLMPIGLENNITVDQMSDLIAFLMHWREEDGVGANHELPKD